MRVLIGLGVIVLLTLASASTSPPALRETVSTHGATYITNIALNVVMAAIKNLTLPEITGSTSMPSICTGSHSVRLPNSHFSCCVRCPNPGQHHLSSVQCQDPDHLILICGRHSAEQHGVTSVRVLEWSPRPIDSSHSLPCYDCRRSGIQVAITADWGYRKDSWPHLSSSGSADISVSDASVRERDSSASNRHCLYADCSLLLLTRWRWF